MLFLCLEGILIALFKKHIGDLTQFRLEVFFSGTRKCVV